MRSRGCRRTRRATSSSRAHLQHRHGGIQPRARRAARHERQDYLTSRGVAANRLEVRSYGEEQPKYDNAREETRRLNRRAALVVRIQ